MHWARRKAKGPAVIFTVAGTEAPIARGYCELLRRVTAVAQSLTALPPGPLAVVVGRHGSTLEAVLGALGTGRPFVLLDATSKRFDSEMSRLQTCFPTAILIPSLAETPELLIDRMEEIHRRTHDAPVWSLGPSPLAERDLTARTRPSLPSDGEDWPGPRWHEPAAYLYPEDESEFDRAYVYTPAALYASAWAVRNWLKLKDGMRVLSASGLSACDGLVLALACLLSGATFILPSLLKAEQFGAIMRDSAADVARVKASVIADILDRRCPPQAISSSNLKFVLLEGGRLPVRSVLKFVETYEVPVIHCYGTAATGGYVLGVPLDLTRREYELALRDNVAGQELDYCNVRIEPDEHSRAEAKAPSGDGLLAVRGLSVSAGTWDGQALRLWDVPWLATSDLARLCPVHHRKYYSILGKREEALVIEGYRIWPGQVEHSLLETFQFLEDCVVTARSDSTGQSQLCAAVILADDLDDHRRSELLALMEARVNAGGVDGLSERSRPDQLLALPNTLVPRDAEGRLDRPKLRHMLAAYDQAGGLAAS